MIWFQSSCLLVPLYHWLSLLVGNYWIFCGTSVTLCFVARDMRIQPRFGRVMKRPKLPDSTAIANREYWFDRGKSGLFGRRATNSVWMWRGLLIIKFWNGVLLANRSLVVFTTSAASFKIIGAPSWPIRPRLGQRRHLYYQYYTTKSLEIITCREGMESRSRKEIFYRMMTRKQLDLFCGFRMFTLECNTYYTPV